MHMQRKKATAGLLTALCLLNLVWTPAFLAAAQSAPQAGAAGTASHYNYALVLDGSGSLTLGQNGLPPSDPNGNRYAAVETLFSLIPAQGDTVDAIVFNDGLVLHTGPQTITGAQDKESLAARIREAPISGSTNIGGALLAAVNDLTAWEQQNGMPGVVILFTDGVTDMRTAALESASRADRDAAVRKARENNIKILGLFLNQNGAYNVSEVFDITRDANGFPAENRYDASVDNNLNSHYAEIRDSSDLTKAQANFRALLTGSGGVTVERFPASGELTQQFRVPALGVSEVNVYIESTESEITALLTKPGGGEPLDGNALAGSSGPRNGRMVINLQQPAPGVWTVLLQGDPNARVSYGVIYNTDVMATLSVLPGETARFRAQLERNGAPVTDMALYDGYSAKVRVTDLETRAEFEGDLRAGTDAFEGTLNLERYHNYSGYAEFFCQSPADMAPLNGNDLTLKSPSVEWQVVNSPPAAVQDSVTISIPKILFFQGQKSLDLGDYFRDDQTTSLQYTLEAQNYPPAALSLSGAQLSIDGKAGGEGEFLVRAADDDGSSGVLKISVVCPNRTLPVLLGLLVLLIAIAGALLFFLTGRRIGGRLEIRITSAKGEAEGAVMFIQVKQRTRLNKSYTLLEVLRTLLQIVSANAYAGDEQVDVVEDALAHRVILEEYVFRAVSKTGDEIDYCYPDGSTRLKHSIMAQSGGGKTVRCGDLAADDAVDIEFTFYAR
jgi:hypothetical protein